MLIIETLIKLLLLLILEFIGFCFFWDSIVSFAKDITTPIVKIFTTLLNHIKKTFRKGK